MLKNLMAVLIYFSFVYLLYAQQVVPKDFFPLEVGNSWTYGFNVGSRSSMSHASSNDSGTVKLTITGKIESSSSTTWQIFQKRDFYRYVYNLPFSGWYKDSSNFELIESKSGLHELYVSPYDKDMVFPFIHASTNSEKIFRYVDTTSSNYLVFTRGKNNGYENDFFKFTFKADTGIVKTTRSWYNASQTSSWARYNLVELKRYYNEPFLILPTKNISISALSQTYKDTSVTILNNGAQPLIISDILSSNQYYQVVNFTSTVQPHSAGNITIRFSPANTGNTAATITIISNSLPSSNKLTINGTAYETAIIHLEPKEDIKFGGIPNGKTKAASYSISNLGNIDLKIDSIKITHTAFSNKIRSISIKPSQTIIDSIYFSPQISTTYSANLKLFSNSQPTPYVLWLFGTSAEEIRVDQNYETLNFGKIPAGQMLEKTVAIRNLGKESIRLVSTIDYDNSNAQEFPFIFSNSSTTLETVIYPNSVFNQIIRFQPKNTKHILGSVINKFYSQNMSLTSARSIRIEANLTDYLGQNYPNPFNATTKIRFQISSSSIVRLSIFDTLGREIYNIINERLEPGKYEKTFNVSGLSSGVYIYRLQAGSYSETKKFVLMK